MYMHANAFYPAAAQPRRHSQACLRSRPPKSEAPPLLHHGPGPLTRQGGGQYTEVRRHTKPGHAHVSGWVGAEVKGEHGRRAAVGVAADADQRVRLLVERVLQRDDNRLEAPARRGPARARVEHGVGVGAGGRPPCLAGVGGGGGGPRPRPAAACGSGCSARRARRWSRPARRRSRPARRTATAGTHGSRTGAPARPPSARAPRALDAAAT